MAERLQLEASARAMAQAEINRRQRAREHLLDFTTYTMPQYRTGRLHKFICQKLEAVESGEVKRLMIFCPPRSGKSELASIRFPAWYLGRNPTKQVITASYGTDLAHKFGRDTRNTVGSKEFACLFPGIGISPDSAARGAWHTNKGGAYVATGVGGGLTGFGADTAICDDLTRDRQDAESETMREAAWDWYRSVLRTRLMPGGSIVILMTRWHPSDVPGRLLEDMQQGTGEKWEVVNLPAIAGEDDALGRQPGEALWPEAYDLEALNAVRQSIGEREWSALYQQSPRAQEGNLFKTALIDTIDAAPKGSQIVRAWDLASTKKVGSRDPDWTVGLKLLKTKDGGFVILDVVRFRGGPEEVLQAIVRTAKQDGFGVKIGLPKDPGQAGAMQVLYITRALQGYTVESSPETGEKTTRASPVASQVNVGNLSIVKAHWNRAVLEEMADFPAGSHDDITDALSRAFAMLGSVDLMKRFRALI